MHVPEGAITGPVQAVAIIGAALRFPGASDPSSFHDLTVAGRRMFRALDRAPDGDGRSGTAGQEERSADRRLLLAALLDDQARGHGRDDDLTGGITARHLLAAETAAAALADIPPVGRAVASERIGVFIADIPEPGTTSVRDWVDQQLRMLAPGDPEPTRARRRHLVVSDAPPLRRVRAGFHDFLGNISIPRPSHGDRAVNSAAHGTAVMNGSAPSALHCSLRAVAQACTALNAGEFDLVLAGGVTKGVGGWPRDPTAAGQAAGSVRVYDASPTGSLPGEGCGIVALTRAADARDLAVPAYAEIVGWHYTSHGVPQAALPQAYLRAGVDPADIQFIEGHGAATTADDLAELAELLNLLGPRSAGITHRCALGSVSANIGDTRAAAGIAALLKTAFAMTADVIPPSTGCVCPNHLLSRDTTPFRLPTAPELWPQTPVQLAAVNTLGTAPYPDAPRSGPVHLVLRRERDLTRHPGRRRKPSPLLPPAKLAMEIPRQVQP
jgi:enediyne polyketide synthase